MADESPKQFERPPRIQPPLPQGQEEIPAPPDRPTGQPFSFLEALLPVTTILGYVVMAITGQGRSLGLMLPMTIAMGASIYIGWRRVRQNDADYKLRVEEYRRLLGRMREEMRRQHQLQRDFYMYTYPMPDVINDLVLKPEHGSNRFGWRLWERRSTDEDFGALRLGLGTRLSHYTYIFNPNDNSGSDIGNEARRLSIDSQFLTETPITVKIRLPYGSDDGEEGAKRAQEVIHSLAIYGRLLEQATPESDVHRTQRVVDYANALLMQYTAFHANTDVNLYVIGTQASKSRWRWARDLPHARTQRNETLLCFDGDRTYNMDGQEGTTERLDPFLKTLSVALNTRQQRLSDKESGDITLPFLLVVVDLLDDRAEPNAESLSSRIAREEAFTLILSQGYRLGAAVIFLTAAQDQIPSETRAIIELEGKNGFRYSQIGLNTPRYVGTVDRMSRFRTDALNEFSKLMQAQRVRASAAATLANAVDLLELNNSSDIDSLDILNRWRNSTTRGEWPSVPIGLKAGNDSRSLTFSADKDGVHGMIAGTTGSGKSELLLTLIVGLALKYDPTIVNFVLVDFKGGAAFEEFKGLPHCVDIVTNLVGNAVDRMFNAIKAELDRRSELIAQYRVKHIVEYRERHFHLESTSSDEIEKFTQKKLGPQPFPHLFIIIDEFAEMVAANPEYKSQLDSITRLGRAIGVSLILATQRPAGMITDQMRANMKFKICLRVETPDDSRELLRRNDAAYLPTGIPGRAYLQIGNELPELIQVARAGGPHQLAPKDIPNTETGLDAPRVIFLKRNQVRKTSSTTLSLALVKEMSGLAYGRETEQKPWPDPLPAYLPLAGDLQNIPFYHYQSKKFEQDTQWRQELRTYTSSDIPALTLNPALAKWAQGSGTWLPEFDWNQALKPVVGLVDHPRKARQMLLRLDLTKGHIAVFSASRWGKTTFLQTLIMSLAATHSPAQLHIYILDFGKHNLDAFNLLPHVARDGGIIYAEDSERIKRLLRILEREIDTRSKTLAQAGAKDFVAYNLKSQQAPLPTIMVVIDNFAELKENFDAQLPALLSLMRSGRTMGIVFAASGDSVGAMSGRIFNQFGQKIVLHMTDTNEYVSIVGRGSRPVPEIAGRGLVAVERNVSSEPLDVQIAMPISLTVEDIAVARQVEDEQDASSQIRIVEERLANKLRDELGTRLEVIVQSMAQAWAEQEGSYPANIGVLNQYYSLTQIAPDETDLALKRHPFAHPILGVEDDNLKPLGLPLDKNPHFIVVGPPLSGRSTVLRSWMVSLARHYAPQDVSMIIIDPQERILDADWQSLEALPHLLGVITSPRQLEQMIEALEIQYRFEPPKDEGLAIQRTSEYNKLVETLVQDTVDAVSKITQDVTEAEKTLEIRRKSLHAEKDEATRQTLERAALEAETDLNKKRKELKKAEDSLKERHALEGRWKEQLAAWNGQMPIYHQPEIFVFIDNFDDLDDITSTGSKDDEDKRLAYLARTYRRDRLHFVLAGTEEVMRSDKDLKRNVWQSRYGFALRTSATAERLQATRIPRDLRDVELVNGRGFLVRSGLPTLVQIATLTPQEFAEEINQINTRYPDDKRAHWLKNQLPDVMLELYKLGQEREARIQVAGFEPKKEEIINYTGRSERNRTHPYYGLLARSLHKLSPMLLEALMLRNDTQDETISPQEIYAKGPTELPNMIYGGRLLLPEEIDPLILQRIRECIDTYDLLIEKGGLLALTPAQLATLKINPAVLAPHYGKSVGLVRDALRSALLSSQFQIPDHLSPELHQSLTQQSEIAKLLAPERLVRMPTELLNQIGLEINREGVEEASSYIASFYDAEKNDFDENRLSQAIANQELVLPLVLPEGLSEVLTEYNSVVSLLGPSRLVMLTPEQLAEYGIQLDGVDPAALSTLEQEEVWRLLFTHSLHLPLRLDQEQRKALNKVPPRGKNKG